MSTQKTYLERPSKDDIALLPTFDGLDLSRVIIVDSADKALLARSDIFSCSHVGFDTETKPNFTPGALQNNPCLVQLSTENKAYLFTIENVTDVPQANDLLSDAVSSTELVKVGFGLKSDRLPMRKAFDVKLENTIDLSKVIRSFGYAHPVGLKAAVSIILKKNFIKSKALSKSNWARKELSDQQKLYAANDAYASLLVFIGLPK